ncbi:MAG: metal ABC transporter substrate-binding protein [Lachnospiraceae bacterium]|nr:metal ABC transporter substrate-binding protein [Lachnospiraceae bacterium]
MNKLAKKCLLLLGIMSIVTVLAGSVGFLVNRANSDSVKGKLKIVTSFYPMYIATMNVVGDVEGVELTNLTKNQGGCLHEYQITTDDMKHMENASVFVTNGAGMESFVEDILTQYPHIKVIDSSDGCELLQSLEEEDEVNSHLWMDPDNYMKQIANIAKGLGEADEEHKEQYEANAKAYIEKIKKLKEDIIGSGLTVDSGKQENVIIFHDAFAYMAKVLGWTTAYAVDIDNDTAMSAGDVADIIEVIKEKNVTLLFAEKQFSDAIPKQIAGETGAKVCIIDSLVSGEMDKDAYIDGMHENIRAMQELLGE